MTDVKKILQDMGNAYVKEKAEELINKMVSEKLISMRKATCEFWDEEYHLMFPRIADELRKQGFNVVKKVGFDTTDWFISIA